MPGLTMECEPKDVIEAFWYSGLGHPEVKRPVNTVYSVIFLKIELYNRYSPEEYYFDTKSGTKHAEELAVEKLRRVLLTDSNRSIKGITITWFVNFSPCRDCSDKIIRFLDEVKEKSEKKPKNIQINMTFPCLYKIQRPSCREKRPTPCPHFNIDVKSHTMNLQGLRNLLRIKGVSLHTFMQADWNQLVNMLRRQAQNIQLPENYNGSEREKEDHLLKQDLRKLLPPVTPLAIHKPTSHSAQPESNMAVEPEPNIAVQPESNMAVNPGPNIAVQPESNMAVNPGSIITVQPRPNMAAQTKFIVKDDSDDSKAGVSFCCPWGSYNLNKATTDRKG